MIGDGHERAGIDVGAHRAGGAGQHHGFRAQQRERFERHPHRIDVAGIVVIGAPAKNHDPRTAENADHEFGLLVGRRPRETRQLVVRNDDGLADLIGNGREPGTQNEADIDPRIANLRAHQFGAFFRVAHARCPSRRITRGS